MDALVHLFRMPLLTQVSLVLSATLPASASPLVFSNLQDITLQSKSLTAISQLLSQTRLPVVMSFSTMIDKCPSKQEISSFLAGVQTSSAGNSIKRLRFTQLSPSLWNVGRSQAHLLGLQDLRPYMAFCNIRQIELEIEWNVDLTDSGLLTLASAWPQLENFVINAEWGWNTPGGITPDGLLQLLQTCPSLRWIALAIDTRHYTELPSSGLLASLGWTTRPTVVHLDVLDSAIQAESVPAIGAFFACTPCGNVSFRSWSGEQMERPYNWEVYYNRWDDVRKWANGLLV